MAVRTVALIAQRRLLGMLGLGPAPDANEVEIAVLRHQLAVLQRQVARPRYTPADRMLLARRMPLIGRTCVGVVGAADPAPAPPRPGTTPRRPQLDAVPPRVGGWLLATDFFTVETVGPGQRKPVITVRTDIVDW